ncbi:hypothetical protein [Gordoniibacillus kamchatkensis]|nr:hypothetical protein [Paenibacillus sp. VKM B-2647]
MQPFERDVAFDREGDEAGAWSCLEAGEETYVSADAQEEDDAFFG